ncbi:MAG TPA: PspC domain-containing protein [Tessaracoccus flavescens]|uniref:PspC domain-containing protein n=1 Tax=Tessaracoccus flavescens TaxID=399497 RepID=A0A921ENU1_9ACTN|nr:PspC domain-containing protein [Tessaracoccus flavescens]
MNITRSNDGMIAGVAAGLARALNVDATIVRLAFVLITLLGGSGVLLYIIAWVIMPRETGGTIAEEQFRKAKTWYDDRNAPKPPQY